VQGAHRFAHSAKELDTSGFATPTRNGDELERAIRYVIENPAKAGLKNWIWVWSAGWEARATAGQEAGATTS
jgi:hypothetical protein